VKSQSLNFQLSALNFLVYFASPNHLFMSELIGSIATGVWTPVLFLLILGGVFFFIYSRFIHYNYFFNSFEICNSRVNFRARLNFNPIKVKL